jgi:hypothetical protein
MVPILRQLTCVITRKQSSSWLKGVRWMVITLSNDYSSIETISKQSFR